MSTTPKASENFVKVRNGDEENHSLNRKSRIHDILKLVNGQYLRLVTKFSFNQKVGNFNNLKTFLKEF